MIRLKHLEEMKVTMPPDDSHEVQQTPDGMFNMFDCDEKLEKSLSLTFSATFFCDVLVPTRPNESHEALIKWSSQTIDLNEFVYNYIDSRLDFKF